MASPAILLIPLLLCSAQLSLALDPQIGVKLIQETCSDTDEPDLCVSSFLTDPLSTKVFYKDMGGVSVRVVVTNATDTRLYIEHLLNKTEDPTTKQCLESCRTIYNDMIDGLKSVSDSMEELEFEPAEEALGVAKTKAEECEEGFKKHNVTSPLTQRNEMIVKLAGNGYVIVGDMMV